MKSTLQGFGFVLLGVVGFLVYVYIVQAYPILWYDSKTYINYGVLSAWQTYGSTFYPLFIRYTLLFNSLWFVVAAQSAIAVYVLWKLLESLDLKRVYYLPILLLLTFTTFAYFSCSIMTDIFLGLGIVLNYLIYKDEISSKEIPLYIVFVMAISAHNGYVYVFLLLNLFLLAVFGIRRKWQYARRSLFSLSLIIFAHLIFNPLIGSLYEHDQRDKRDLNFYCRQILLCTFDGQEFIQELRDAGCNEDLDYEICTMTMSRDNKYKLKIKSDLEPQCESVFKTALANPEFRNNFIWTRITNVFVSMQRVHLLTNSGSQAVLDIIKKRIGEEPFLPITGSKIYQASNIKAKKHATLSSINRSLVSISIFIILMSFIAYIILVRISPKLTTFQRQNIYMCLFFLLAMLIAICFYCWFSRFTNRRYITRMSWLLVFSAALFVKSWVEMAVRARIK